MAHVGIYLYAGDENRVSFLNDDTPALRIETKSGGAVVLSFHLADREGMKMLRDIMNDVLQGARSRHLDKIANWKRDAANAE